MKEVNAQHNSGNNNSNSTSQHVLDQVDQVRDKASLRFQLNLCESKNIFLCSGVSEVKGSCCIFFTTVREIELGSSTISSIELAIELPKVQPNKQSMFNRLIVRSVQRHPDSKQTPGNMFCRA